MRRIARNTRGGTRTHNLLLRREAPYPLGHTSMEYFQESDSPKPCAISCELSPWSRWQREDFGPSRWQPSDVCHMAKHFNDERGRKERSNYICIVFILRISLLTKNVKTCTIWGTLLPRNSLNVAAHHKNCQQCFGGLGNGLFPDAYNWHFEQ